jgi:hypothetical protein
VALLADPAAELLDCGVIKLVERVKVGDLLVVVESGRCTLLESEDAYIHHNHVPADERGDVVKGTSFILLLSIGRVALVAFAGRRRLDRRVGNFGIGVAGHNLAGPRHCCWWLVGWSILVESWLISVKSFAIWSSQAGCGRQRRRRGSDKHKRYAYH